MRRIISALLAALLAISGCAAALADDDGLKAVSCPEQGFSTRIPANSDSYFTPDGGLTIQLGAADDGPWLSINRADVPGSEFNAQGYFENAFTPLMRQSEGDDLIKVGQYTSNNIAGIEMMGVQYVYLCEGRERTCVCLFDLREDGFVRYEARYYGDEQDRTLLVLALAALNYQPDAGYYD